MIPDNQGKTYAWRSDLVYELLGDELAQELIAQAWKDIQQEQERREVMFKWP